MNLDTIKAYLNGLNPRERYMVIAATVVVGLFLPYQIIWAPFTNRLSTLEDKINQQQQTAQWMQQAAAEVRQLSGGKGKGNQRRGKQLLLGLINKTAQRSKLVVSKVQPEGQKGARVWLDNAVFDDVIAWLEGLQVNDGVAVSELSVEHQAAVGKVNARVLLETY